MRITKLIILALSLSIFGCTPLKVIVFDSTKPIETIIQKNDTLFIVIKNETAKPVLGNVTKPPVNSTDPLPCNTKPLSTIVTTATTVNGPCTIINTTGHILIYERSNWNLVQSVDQLNTPLTINVLDSQQIKIGNVEPSANVSYDRVQCK